MKRQDVVFSGMRPTGRLHLGNYWGALKNWVGLMAQYPCYFSVVDWHMLTTGYNDTSKLKENVREMVLDWLAAGLDPAHGGSQGGPIEPGAAANLCVVDPSATWTVDPTALASRSRNTPYTGRKLTGRVRHTILAGEPVVIDAVAQR